MQFEREIRTREELRAIIPEPREAVTRKTLQALDRHCRAFIARSPFLVLGTSAASGAADLSPKGDPPGFVRVLDDETLAIPDRLGNRRMDSMENILQNPSVGVIFFVPGKTETLRVAGDARIVQDAPLLDSMAVKGKRPDLAFVVHVKEAFFHCSKCMIRSGLWQPERRPDLEGLPTLAQTMIDGGKLDMTVEELHERVLEDERTRLY